ncbi:winged helix-turn-helix transcriptional regulator [Hydrogenophaga sp. XSHU_21]
MSLHKSTAEFAERCPIRDVLERLGDRWTMLVLFTLEDGGTQRFSVLKSRIPDISQRMLAQTLRRIEQDGLVLRTVYPAVPPRVDYALTPLGESFLKPMHQLLDWAAAHHGDVRAARLAYRPVPATPAL